MLTLGRYALLSLLMSALYGRYSCRPQELLLQEGHCRPSYCVAFHPDGSLAATGGLDCVCRVWDMRTGRNITTFQGHVKHILSVDFSPGGFTLATGSEDHSIKIWDMRKKRVSYTIPGHSSLVSRVRYGQGEANTLMSTSYDNTVKVCTRRVHVTICTVVTPCPFF